MAARRSIRGFNSQSSSQIWRVSPAGSDKNFEVLRRARFKIAFCLWHPSSRPFIITCEDESERRMSWKMGGIYFLFSCDWSWSLVYLLSQSIPADLFTLWVFNRFPCARVRFLIIRCSSADIWSSFTRPAFTATHSRVNEMIKCGEAALEETEKIKRWRCTSASEARRALASAPLSKNNKDNYCCREYLIILLFRIQPLPSHFIAPLKMRSLMS